MLDVKLNFLVMALRKAARSARACSLLRYLRLASLISLNKTQDDKLV